MSTPIKPEDIQPDELLDDNIFVPKQYTFANPVNLTDIEKIYIKMILQLSEAFIANNTMNLIIAGWYNVTFDNYPTLRSLLPSNYTDTIVGLAGQITIAIQDLRPGDIDPLKKQFIPIGRRHYMHGAEAVTLLCSAPCLVQSMYNLLVSAGGRLISLLEGVNDNHNLMSLPLKKAGLTKQSDGVEESPSAAPSLTDSERRLLRAFATSSSSEEGVYRDFTNADFQTFDSMVEMVNPRSLSLGVKSPNEVAQVKMIAATINAELETDTGLGQRLVEALQHMHSDHHGIFHDLFGDFSKEELGQMGQSVPPSATAEEVTDADFKDLLGQLSWKDLPKKVQERIIQAVITFILRYVLPILLIPFGRFVNTMVDIITSGLRTERTLRILRSWNDDLKPRSEELSRTFLWTLLEICPEVRFPLGLQTGAQLEVRMDQLTKELAEALRENVPMIMAGGLPFKQQLMQLGATWAEAGWPMDGYDAVRQAILATIDSMLFAADPAYAASVPGRRLKDAYSQLVSIVNTEFIYGTGGNAFPAMGGLLAPSPPIPATKSGPGWASWRLTSGLKGGATTFMLAGFDPAGESVPVRFQITSPSNGSYSVLISDLGNGNTRIFSSDPITWSAPNKRYSATTTATKTMKLLVQVSWSLNTGEEVFMDLAVGSKSAKN